MPEESPAPPREEPSSWSLLPDADAGDGKAPAAGDGPETTGGGLRGIRAASRMLAEGRAAMEREIGQSELPDLASGEPVEALAMRLDREADFWRAWALRAQVRTAWLGRIVVGVAVAAFVGTLLLAVVAGVQALFGGGSGAGALSILAGAAVLVAGAVAVSWTVGAVRREGREVAQAALRRADLAELRLQRVGVLLALRRTDDGAFREALGRLERDASAPPR